MKTDLQSIDVSADGITGNGIADTIPHLRFYIFDPSHRLGPITRQVGEAGFEPAKAEPPDLQSGPFGRSGIPPSINLDSLTS